MARVGGANKELPEERLEHSASTRILHNSASHARFPKIFNKFQISQEM
jgi:hypothetical protein